MMNFFKNLSIQSKIAIIAIPTVAVAIGIGVAVYNKTNYKDIQVVSAAVKNVELKEEVFPEVKEEVITVAVDNSIQESLVEKEEPKEIEFEGIKAKTPKSKVAAPKSKDDPENNKKKGGDAVSQSQAESMFENTGVKSRGIDVSSWQGNINWAQVKASGVDFAIIRAGFRGYGNGSMNEDAYFKQNVANATANGIKVGIYFYSAAVNETEALEEAMWVVEKIVTYRITYPVVYDCEEIGVPGHRTAGVSGAQAASNANTFLSYIKSRGYEPMLYANKSDIGKMGRGNFSCKFWLAHYTTGGQPTDYTGSHQMWQYTSSGSVPGVPGRVDMNVAYFSYGSVAAPMHTHDFSEVVRNSRVEPTCYKEGKETLKCSCGETQDKVLPKTEHKLSSWEVRTEATEEQEGLEFRKCTNSGCNYEETRKIDKLEPEVIDPKDNNNTSEDTNTSKDTDTNTSEDTNTNTNTDTNSSIENDKETDNNVTEP